MNILAGDIGGTNSRLAIYDVGPRGLHLETQQTFPSAEFRGLAEIVSRFVEQCRATCEVVCLGLPGPVTTDRVIQLTNLPWEVDHERIREASGTSKVALINDVEASAIGVQALRTEDVDRLHEGQPDPSGNRAVISVGTGLGVAGLMASGRAFATEAGHASFSPRDDFDIELLGALEREFGYVSWERLASGPALPRIYAHLAEEDAPALAAPEIVERYQADSVCRKTVDTFCRYLGAVAGNIALTLMATGGVYFCGGVAPRVLDETGASPVLESFFDKGRMRKVLERMPVYLVRDGNLALKGAAHTALRLVENASGRRDEGR